MVLRETGAGWLASMMRAEREPDARLALLEGALEPEMLEAQERRRLPRDTETLSRRDRGGHSA